ncbi:MAG: hypothetical protein IJW97_02070 [Clostridia bacterium]|nr:hypothetical protein [Clostridia bacterium]
MIIKQLSVFLENKQGRLCSAVDVLAKNDINISALSLADTTDFGILRLLVDQPEKAQAVLSASGVVVRITNVIAIAMNDNPGGAVEVLHCLSEAALNVEYIYACVGRVSGKALMVIRVDDEEVAEQVLHAHGYNDINPADVYRI